MLLSFFQFFAKKLRLSKPWKYKVPLILAFTYFFILTGNTSHQEFIYSFLASIVTVIGFTGIGYLTNDFSDREKDKEAGKENSLADYSTFQIFCIALFLLALALFPWLYLPIDFVSVSLIFIELLLFALYAFPPFRLKEKGALGLVVDALYAHVIPAILASWTFYLLGGANYALLIPFLIVLGSWQLISGVRNIMSHQIQDVENDIKSETHTWVTKYGVYKGERILKNVLIPLEIISLLGFLFFIQKEISYLILVIIGFLVMVLLKYYKNRQKGNMMFRKQFTNLFLDDFYIKWLPLIILSGIIFIETEVRTVLLIHLLLFQQELQNIVSKCIHKMRSQFGDSLIVSYLFRSRNYYKAFAIHIGFMMLYVSFFVILYFILDFNTENDEVFIWQQKILSKFLVITILFHAFSFFLFRKEQTIKILKAFVFEKVSAYNLAIFRIIFFTILIKSMHIEVFGPFKSWSYLPDQAKVELPFIGWLIDWLPVNPDIYYTLSVIGLILAYSGLFGLGTKWSLKVYIPIALYLWGVPCFYGKLNHHHLMVWIPIIFAFTPCSDVLSVDALIKKLRGKFKKPSPSLVYGLPLKVLWLLFGIIYCCSGFHKLWDTGLYWALSENIVRQIQLEWIENYDVITAFRIDHYPILLKIGGVGVILFEILYPIFLIKPATRFLNLLGSWTLHLTAGYFLNIDFAYLRKSHLSLINWQKYWKLIRRKKTRIIKEIDRNNFQDHTWSSLRKYKIVYVGAILVGFNLVFGILGINSWPFSAYPAYSSIVKENVALIRMKAIDHVGKEIDVKKIGKDSNFRWENIRPFEERIAEAIQKNDTINLHKKLKAYWELWSTKVNGLEKIVTVEMYLETTSLVPEERNILLNSKYLGTVKINIER